MLREVEELVNEGGKEIKEIPQDQHMVDFKQCTEAIMTCINVKC